MKGGEHNDYVWEEKGKLGTTDYKVYIKQTYVNIPVSSFHQIPLWVHRNKKVARMIVEIPKDTHYKLEITKNVKLNPITHDIKDGKVREVAMAYPAHYGALPQTWENPEHLDKYTNAKGDNDPIDAFNISSDAAWTGKVMEVKVLGVYAMIDKGETDWKVICISNDDPISEKINSLADVEREMPGKLNAIFTFLRDYKKKDANDVANENKFAFEGKPQDVDFAVKIIDETHEEWRKLVSGEVEAKDIWIPKYVEQSEPTVEMKSLDVTIVKAEEPKKKEEECTIL